MVDIYGAAQVTALGGLVGLYDMWMPSVRAAVRFFERNFPNFQRVPSPVENAAIFRKVDEFSRPWDHFVPFNEE